MENFVKSNSSSLQVMKLQTYQHDYFNISVMETKTFCKIVCYSCNLAIAAARYIFTVSFIFLYDINLEINIFYYDAAI